MFGLFRENKPSKKFNYKKDKSLDQLRAESAAIIIKYPTKIPVIVEEADENDPDLHLDKRKFLVPQDLSISQFMYVIRKRIKMPPEKALFLFVNNAIPAGSALMSEVYHEHKDDCGFLVMTLSGERCFGNEN